MAAKRNWRRWPHYGSKEELEKTATLWRQRETGEDGHITAARRNWRRRPHYGGKEKLEKMVTLCDHIMAARRHWRRWPHYGSKEQLGKMATSQQQRGTGEDGHIMQPHYSSKEALEKTATATLCDPITAARRNWRRLPHYGSRGELEKMAALWQQRGTGEDGHIMQPHYGSKKALGKMATLRKQGGTRKDGHIMTARRNWKRRPHSPCRLNFVCSINLQLVKEEEGKTLTDKQLLVHRDSPHCLISTLGSSPNPSFFPNSSTAITSVETCTHGTMAMCVTTATPGHLY